MVLCTAIVLYGSRGDVQPGTCLALELQGRGHRVTVLAPPDLTDLVSAAGVADVVPIGRSMVAPWTSDEGRDVLRSRNPIRKLRFAAAAFGAAYGALDDSLAELVTKESSVLRNIDLLISGPVSQSRCLAASEALAVPLVVLRYGPLSENGTIGAYAGLTDTWSPEWKRRSWRLNDRFGRLVTRGGDTRFRARIGLAPSRGTLPAQLTAHDVPQIQAFDPAMAPDLQTEWNDSKPIVGFFDLPAEGRNALTESGTGDPDLTAWLDAGEPPVFVSFGSMPLPDPAVPIGLLRDAVRAAGARCLISWSGGIGPAPRDGGVYSVGALDHRAILPRCIAAIHHGGAGTTAATLRAGLPTFICAVTADQPQWAGLISALGVGYGSRIGKLSPEVAAAGVAVILDPTTKSAAQAFANRMISPADAVSRAASIIETYARTQGSS